MSTSHDSTAPEPSSTDPDQGTTPGPGDDPAPPVGRAKDDDPLRGSRTSGVWVATVGLGLLLVLLIVFIAQNTDTTTVYFLSFQGEAPVAVALLIATAAGILLTAIAGSLRIIQLRRRTKKGLKHR